MDLNGNPYMDNAEETVHIKSETETRSEVNENETRTESSSQMCYNIHGDDIKQENSCGEEPYLCSVMKQEPLKLETSHLFSESDVISQRVSSLNDVISEESDRTGRPISCSVRNSLRITGILSSNEIRRTAACATDICESDYSGEIPSRFNVTRISSLSSPGARTEQETEQVIPEERMERLLSEERCRVKTEPADTETDTEADTETCDVINLVNDFGNSSHDPCRPTAQLSDISDGEIHIDMSSVSNTDNDTCRDDIISHAEIDSDIVGNVSFSDSKKSGKAKSDKRRKCHHSAGPITRSRSQKVKVIIETEVVKTKRRSLDKRTVPQKTAISFESRQDRKKWQTDIPQKSKTRKGKPKTNVSTGNNPKVNGCGGPGRCSATCRQQSNRRGKRHTCSMKSSYNSTNKWKPQQKAFIKQSLLSTHRLNHKKEKTDRDSVCTRSMSQSSQLKTHSSTHSKVKPHLCDICNRSFSLLSTLMKHKLIHSSENPYVCKFCDKTFEAPHSFRKHCYTHTGEKPYSCDACYKAFSIFCSLKEHSRIHTGEKPHVCKVCNKAFITSSGLNKHSLIHSGEKPYTCETCGRNFVRKDALKAHQWTHSGEKPHTCDFCEKSFARSAQLKVHKRTHSGRPISVIKRHSCNICNKLFLTPTSLKFHSYTHTGEKPFMCEICGRTFSRPHHVKVHMFMHTKEKLGVYTCKFCNEAFSDENSLRTHTQTHPIKKPYACNICTKAFSHQSTLAAHKRIHSCEKPYKCNFCEKAFSQSSNLNRHRRTHSGVKPYKCEVCYKCFTQPSSLKDHSRIHTGEKPFVCDICGKAYSQLSNLRTHIRAHSQKAEAPI